MPCCQQRRAQGMKRPSQAISAKSAWTRQPSTSNLPPGVGRWACARPVRGGMPDQERRDDVYHDTVCRPYCNDSCLLDAIYPVLLGNWTTAVQRADKSPSWFSATSANSTYFLPSSLAYLLVMVPRINNVSPSGLWRLISHESLCNIPSSPIQLVTVWLSHEQRSGP